MRGCRWVLVALLVVFSAGVAWACGGDDEGDGETPAATSPAEGTPDAGETQENGGDGGESSDLARRLSEATFKATYEFTGGGAGVGTMTWYKKGDSMRFDVVSEVEGQQMTATIITRPDVSYLCTQDPQLGEEGFCLESPTEVGGGMSEIIGGLDAVLSDPGVEIESTGSREIVGEDADCLIIRSPEFEGESEMCVSEEGAPLWVRSTEEGVEFSMEATDFSRDVSDDDFEPPYPPGQGFPGLPDIGSESEQ